MMQKNTKQILIWSIVVLVVVLIIAVTLILSSTNTVTQTTTGNNSTQNNGEQDISSQDTGIAATAISYSNALTKYADRRIQLDLTCQAHPNTVTYKDNTGIMIDNRSPNTRTIKVGTTFTIKPYGFKILVLPDVYLKSKTLLVDCDGYQNVATILVQE